MADRDNGPSRLRRGSFERGTADPRPVERAPVAVTIDGLVDQVVVDATRALGWVGPIKGPAHWQGFGVVSVLRHSWHPSESPLAGVLVVTDNRDGLRIASQFAGHAERAILVRSDCRDLLALRMSAAVLDIGVVVYDWGEQVATLLDSAGPAVPAAPSYQRNEDPWFTTVLSVLTDAPTLVAS